MATPRWGETDPQAASIALGVTIPLAIIVAAAILWLGKHHAPSRAHQISREYMASSLSANVPPVVSD